MSHKITQSYFFTGPQEVEIYTEKEMADALHVSTHHLRILIESGRFGFSYHGNPLNTPNKEYTFLKSSYDKNKQTWLESVGS